MRHLTHNTIGPCPAAVRRRRTRRGGFTLIEAAMATVIIGTGFVGLLGLIATGTQTNRLATQDTTAINLANNIYEASLRVPFSNVFSLAKTYSPAVDGQLAPLSGVGDWKQIVTVQYVDRNYVKQTVANTQVEPTVRVTVAVTRNGTEVYRASWLTASSG